MTTPTIEQLTARAEAAEASVLVLHTRLGCIANAKPAQWDADMRDEFRTWAQNVARSALTDTAPLAAKIRQEIVDSALEASAKAVEDIFDQYFVQGVAYEIRAMKGKPL